MISGAATSFASFANRRGPRQFVKFCIVGFSSLAIDLVVFNTAYFALHIRPAFAVILAFLCGVANGYVWNSRWTFKEAQRDARKQAPKFLATNTVGLILNLLVTTAALVAASRLGLMHTRYSVEETLRLVFERKTNEAAFTPLAMNLAKVCAAVVVTAWNFTAAKFFTFKA
jgi:putative flippase GtrA